MPHVHTSRDVNDVYAALQGKQSVSAKGQADGYAPLDGSGKVPSANLPASQGGSAWGDITGTLSDQTDLQTALNAKAASSHNHDGTYATAGHNHDAAYSALAHDHSGIYEPADAAIQTHVLSAHAPSNAQKNSDITKAEIEAKLTGEISSHSHAGGPGGEAFPVGSVFISVVATDPATLLGYGTWEAFGAGRVLVGQDTGDTDFDTLEETGGAKTVTLTAAQSGLPQHTHLQNAHTHTQDAHTHNFLPRSGTTGSVSSIVTGTLDTSSSIGGANQPHVQLATATNQTTTAVNQNAGPSDAAAAHTNVQPYTVVKFWKRTA